jgi:hypothetical protein
MNADDVEVLVQSELRRMPADLCASLSRYIVAPELHERTSMYGAPGRRYVCWYVAKLPRDDRAIAYCPDGLSRDDPWLIVSTKEMDMGSDALWHLGLDHAYRDSGQSDVPLPPGYEIP